MGFHRKSIPAHHPRTTTRPSWQDLSRRMSSGLDCLAMFMALESAEILAGSKPANLINIVNRIRPCGRNLYQLWRTHGSEILSGSGLAAKVLVDRKSSLLLLVYDPGQLDALLSRRDVATVLHKSGYTMPCDSQQSLDQLAMRMTFASFPHEIGVFLGYPLKDVVGFMGWARLPFTCQGPWKIYGDPRTSLELAECHRRCRTRMAMALSSCGDPLQLLRKMEGAHIC